VNTHADKTLENKSQTVDNRLPKLQSKSESTFQLVDNRPEAIAQRKLQEAISNSPRVQQLKAYQEMANNSPQVSQLRAIQDRANNSPQFSKTAQLQSMADNHSAQQQQPIQKKENNTGLPDNLKTGMENLSGMSLDDVKVHRNSDKPAQLQAHAYAQGTDIHLGPGQEKHLPHEAWHVVQQKQGRVKPTMQLMGKVNVNDDAGLEKEADMMGAKALVNNSITQKPNEIIKESYHSVAQLEKMKGYLKADASLYNEDGRKIGPSRIVKGSELEHDTEKKPLKGKLHTKFPKAKMENNYFFSENTEGYVLDYKVEFFDMENLPKVGNGKIVMTAWGSESDYLLGMNSIVGICDYLNEYIERAATSEADVAKWRKRVIAMNAGNAALGSALAALGIAAIVASAGTLLIPIAVVGGVMAAGGIAAGVAGAGMNQARTGGGHSKIKAGLVETVKTGAIQGGKQGILAAVGAASPGAATSLATGLTPAGGVIGAGMGVRNAYKGYKVDPNDVWKSLPWVEIKEKILIPCLKKLENEKDKNQSMSRDFDLTINKVRETLSKIKA
jgi:hypothetical protein